MLAFGLILIWAWRRARAGDVRPLTAATVIGILYVGIGAFGLVYRDGDPFMGTFVVLGGVLLSSGYVVRSRFDGTREGSRRTLSETRD